MATYGDALRSNNWIAIFKLYSSITWGSLLLIFGKIKEWKSPKGLVLIAKVSSVSKSYNIYK